MFKRMRQMLIKEFIQVFRDPRMRTVIFVIPCVQVLVIGYAVTTDVKHVRHGRLRPGQQRGQPRADGAVRRRSGYFDVVAYRRRPGPVRELLDRGEASIVLRFDHGFAADLRARPHGPAADHRRRHRLEHGRDRAQLRRQDRRASIRRQVLVEPVRSSRWPGERACRGRSTCGAGPGSTRTWKAATSTCPA